MDEVNDIQKLLKKQKAYQKNVHIMIQKLFDVQNEIAEVYAKSIMEEEKKN